MSLNRVTLVGNVGQEPELVKREGREDFVTFSFATHETYKDKESGERQSKTEWHNIAVFNPGLVKIVDEHVGQGKGLIIEGSIRYRTSEGEDGNKRYFTDIVARDITFLPGSGKNEESQEVEEAA